MENEFVILEQNPDVVDYLRLRQAMGWHEVSANAAIVSLKNSLYAISILHNGKVIACGRVIGDGAVYFYIQDVMVLPAYQGRGIGKYIMERVMEYVEAHAHNNSFIGLMSSKGKAGFYEKLGFEIRPHDGPGMCMWWMKDDSNSIE